jgi:hypothetical protein
MASLSGVVVRHERRIRLRFDGELAATAFQSTTFYAVDSQDGRGVSPAVAGVLVVSSDLHQAELALGSDLVAGALYAVTVTGAPAADGTLASGMSLFRVGEPTIDPAALPEDDLAQLLFGTDLVFGGADYVEAPNGDLATISGLPNLEAAQERRLTSDGLPWDPAYGAKPRRYVDGAQGALPWLRGALVKEALQDDRIAQADATLGDDGVFAVDLVPIGPATALSIPVPVRTT